MIELYHDRALRCDDAAPTALCRCTWPARCSALRAAACTVRGLCGHMAWHRNKKSNSPECPPSIAWLCSAGPNLPGQLLQPAPPDTALQAVRSAGTHEAHLAGDRWRVTSGLSVR